VVACGGGEQAATALRGETWNALEAEHQALTASRAELADLRMQLLEVPAADAEEPEEAAMEEGETEEGAIEEGAIEEGATEEGAAEPMTAEQIQARIDELDNALVTQAEDFGTHLVEFINADPVYQGEELTESQRAAFSLKSGEDIILGQEYIDKGGDYRRAIEIFETALMVDAGNPDVIAALEKAKADRFMTEERFALVSQGMSERQVKALLGQVYHHNVREYPEKDVVAWFFPKEAGGAAGVYFQLHKKSETYQVYRVDFEAVKAATEEGGEESEPEAP
jgi:hypothetical protein